MARPRHYLVGLSVLVTVDDDGTVTYDVFTEDAGIAVDQEYSWGQDADSEKIIEADIQRIEADIDKRRQEGKL